VTSVLNLGFNCTRFPTKSISQLFVLSPPNIWRVRDDLHIASLAAAEKLSPAPAIHYYITTLHCASYTYCISNFTNNLMLLFNSFTILYVQIFSIDLPINICKHFCHFKGSYMTSPSWLRIFNCPENTKCPNMHIIILTCNYICFRPTLTFSSSFFVQIISIWSADIWKLPTVCFSANASPAKMIFPLATWANTMRPWTLTAR
jgi:hypothetical protein